MARITVRFETGEPDRVVEIDLARAPFQHDGLPGSLLDALLGHGVPLEHACGGSCACTTCHVVVERGSDRLSAAEEAEEDMLDKAPGLTPSSRLACQAVIDGDDAEIVIRVPRHTINLVSGHG